MQSIRSTLLARWIILNAFLLAVFSTAFYYGVIDRFLIDSTRITHLIIGLFLLTLAMNGRTVWQIHQAWKTVGEKSRVYMSERAAGRDAEQRDLIAEEMTRYLSGYKMMGTLLVSLGLLGTVVGILLAFGGVTPDIVADPSAAQATIVLLLSGLTTAFNTTLAGMVGMIWNTLNMHLMRTDLSKMFTTVLGA